MLQAPSSVNVQPRSSLTRSPGPQGLMPPPGIRDMVPQNKTFGGSHANLEAGAGLIQKSVRNTSGVTGVGGRLDITA